MRFRPRKDTGSGSALTESTPVPPTPAELEWWAEARRPLRRRTMAIQGTVFSALAGANLLLTDTAGFLDGGWLSEVPIAVGLVVGGTWLSWRLVEHAMRPRYILGKRIRDELLDPAHER